MLQFEVNEERNATYSISISPLLSVRIATIIRRTQNAPETTRNRIPVPIILSVSLGLCTISLMTLYSMPSKAIGVRVATKEAVYVITPIFEGPRNRAV